MFLREERAAAGLLIDYCLVLNPDIFFVDFTSLHFVMASIGSREQLDLGLDD